MMFNSSNLLLLSLLFNFTSNLLASHPYSTPFEEHDELLPVNLENLSFDTLLPLTAGVNPANSWSRLVLTEVEQQQQLLMKRAAVATTVASRTPYPPSSCKS